MIVLLPKAFLGNEYKYVCGMETLITYGVVYIYILTQKECFLESNKI